MHEEASKRGPEPAVHHEPLVSETLKRNAEEHRREAKEAPETAGEGALDDGPDTPQKRHGDALLDGSGSRHGVHQPGVRPDTCD